MAKYPAMVLCDKITKTGRKVIREIPIATLKLNDTDSILNMPEPTPNHEHEMHIVGVGSGPLGFTVYKCKYCEEEEWL